MLEYYSILGELRIAALEKGGDALLDKVNSDLGVAQRHLDRVSSGTIPWKLVEKEVQQSIQRAQNTFDGNRK